MRNLLLLLAALLTLTLASTFAANATVLTSDQVKNVCGKDIKSGYGHTGCEKVCGKTVCSYDCYKGKCSGIVLLVKNPVTGPKDLNAGILSFVVARSTALGICQINPKTGTGPFACTAKCDLQICDYNCTTADMCSVFVRPTLALRPRDPFGPTGSLSSGGGGNSASSSPSPVP